MKKGIKDAATAGTTVFDQLTQGAQTVQHVSDVQDAHDVQALQYAPPLERLNLRIPADIKEYLQAAAYRESSPKKTVSLTEYLCKLVRADMEKHKND